MYAIMHRTQILLDKAQYDTLKALSERKGLSLSSLVREAVGVYLRSGRDGGAADLGDIEGIGSDAKGRGRRHDDYLYPAPKKKR